MCACVCKRTCARVVHVCVLDAWACGLCTGRLVCPIHVWPAPPRDLADHPDRLNGGEWYSCPARYDLSGQEHGHYALELKAVDNAGNITVADWGNHRIQVFDTMGSFQRTIGHEGEGDAIAAAAGGRVEKGPPKDNERLFNKARLSYADDLQRVTDYERRSVVCQSFPQLIQVLKAINLDFKIVRIKNRFAKTNEVAKDTGAYRDCQLNV